MKEKSAPHTFIQVKALGKLARKPKFNLLLLQESFHKLSIFVSENNSCEQSAMLQFRNLFSHVVLFYFLKRPEESFMSLKFYVWEVFSQLCKFVQKPPTTLSLTFYSYANTCTSVGFITYIMFCVQNTVAIFFLSGNNRNCLML